MKKTVEIEEFDFEELSKSNQDFLNQAITASDQAFAPYSEFYVGCSVECESGKITLGSNQENASFPSGLCAERVALFELSKTLSTDKVKRLAVYARSEKYKVPKMLVPCAACLQVISDIYQRQKSNIEIWMWDGKGKVYKADNVDQFLPFSFQLVSAD